MKKVVCTITENYGNDEFDGPDPKKGDVLTVKWEGMYNGIYSYQFEECGDKYLYSAYRYEPAIKKLNIPNPEALDMGEMFGIPMERRIVISVGMDAMVKMMTTGETKMVYGSEVIRYIENLCETQEEFSWALCNHIAWMLRTGRMAKTEAEQDYMINKYGQPKKL